MTAKERFPRRNYQPQPRRTASADGSAQRQSAAPTAWEPQAQWYDQLVGEDGDDFYRHLILPTVLSRLAAQPGQTVLDVACGQGVLGRVLATQLVKTVGVDASPALIDAAHRRAGTLERHVVGDVRELDQALSAAELHGQYDHAAAVLSLQDLDPLPPVLAGVAARVVPFGRLVVVLTHPCFRVPKRSGWGFDSERGLQYRRMDGYLRPLAVPIRTHPGMPANPSRTLSFHRPLSTYAEALGGAGFGITSADELCSHRRGSQGSHSAAEDRALTEFPLFLVLTAVRLPAAPAHPGGRAHANSVHSRPPAGPPPAPPTTDVAGDGVGVVTRATGPMLPPRRAQPRR